MSFFDQPIPVVPAWKMALVRLFGQRYRTFDGPDYYVWRGRIYIESFGKRTGAEQQ